MTHADPFYSPKQTLARAKHHLAEFQSKEGELSKGEHWTYVIERDPTGRNNKHTVKFERDFFEQLCGIAFDIANNLRSTLDANSVCDCDCGRKDQAEARL